MTAYYAPGVYIEEISTGPRPIAASPTNIAAFIGQTERGPLLTPKRLTGWNDYLETFGDFMEGSYTAESVYGFFRNGGSECFVVRASVGKAALWNLRDSHGKTVLTVNAVSPGPWGNNLLPALSLDDQSASGRLVDTSFQLAGNPDGDDVTVSVNSSVGLVQGQTVRLISDSTDNDGGRSDVSVAGTVKSISGTQVTVTVEGAATVPQGAGRLVSEVPQGQNVVALSAASGFRKGDLVKVDVPGEKERFLQLREALNAGVGMQLTFAEALAKVIPASAWARKQFTHETRLKRPVEPDSSGIRKITLVDLETSSSVFGIDKSVLSDGDYLETTHGLVAYWDKGGESFPLKGVSLAESTPVKLHLSNFATREISSTVKAEELNSRLGFLHVGETAGLVADDGNVVTVTKEQTNFSVGSDITGKTFTKIQFPMNPTEFVDGAGKNNAVILYFPAAPEVDDWLELADGKFAQIHSVTKVEATERSLYRVTFQKNVGNVPSNPADRKMLVRGWQATRFGVIRLNLRVAEVVDGAVRLEERYDNLSLDAEHARFILREGVINDVSRLVTIAKSPPSEFQVKSRDDLPLLLEIAEQGTLINEVSPALMKQGIMVLEKELDPALVACPDAMLFGKDQELELSDVLNSLVEHCQTMNRFAVLDTPGYINNDDDLLAWRNRTLDSTYAAVYAPWVQIMNQRPNPIQRTQLVPPSGYVMGVIARTDQERGVHKAPANERVQAIVGLKKNYTQNEQSSLNRNSINLIRAFPGRGTRIWGARNVTNDTLWRYVNVRRLFLMVENSIQRNTEWLVFEPNDASTWLAARVTVETFLNGVWRSGGLQGASPEEAYEVRVGKGITMTQADIDLGYLIIEVRIAPVKPAEFVVFRISHKRDA
jgi:uncharacterized protein